jgi:excisionase family DNA binding protein
MTIHPLMTAPEVAALLHCSERTVEDHARAGVLPGYKFGDGWVFPADALLEAVNTLAKAEAARRAQPVKLSAVKFQPTPKRGRPDLAVLGA